MRTVMVPGVRVMEFARIKRVSPPLRGVRMVTMDGAMWTRGRSASRMTSRFDSKIFHSSKKK